LLDVVDDGQTGFLVDVGDVDGMAEAAVDILSDDTRRRQLGVRAREVALERYAHDRIIPAYEGFYREILEKAGVTASNA
jgi:glycosyltransferase involved in cell wall biosynthesis